MAKGRCPTIFEPADFLDPFRKVHRATRRKHWTQGPDRPWQQRSEQRDRRENSCDRSVKEHPTCIDKYYLPSCTHKVQSEHSDVVSHVRGVRAPPPTP